MPQTYDAPVSHERTPSAEHRVRTARAYLVLSAEGRVVATDDPAEGASAGLLQMGTAFGLRLIGESPATPDDVVLRRYGDKVSA